MKTKIFLLVDWFLLILIKNELKCDFQQTKKIKILNLTFSNISKKCHLAGFAMTK